MGILRLVLAISVVVAHSNPIFGNSLVGGKIAVQAFYIISGFYMALILNEKYVGLNGSYTLFLTNRFIRIFPIYWCVLILTALLSLVSIVLLQDENVGKLWGFVNYYEQMNGDSLFFLAFTNIFLFFQDVVMFLGLDSNDGSLFFTANFSETTPRLHTFLLIPQGWTIGIELMFYIVAPFLVKRRSYIILILLILSLSIKIGLHVLGFDYDPWTYRFFPAEILFFMLGILSYRMYQRMSLRLMPSFYFVDIVLLFVLTFTFLFYSIPIQDVIKEIVYFGVLFLSVPLIFSRTKNLKMDSYIGELSYPIYISHLFVFSLMYVLGIPKNGLVLTVLTVVFSVVLNQLVAKRIERFRQNRVAIVAAFPHNKS